MKVCICTFHNDQSEGKVGGITTGPFRMKSMLKRVDPSLDVDIVAITKQTKHSCDGVKFMWNDCSGLEDYDFIIFKTPGYQLEKYDESKADTKYKWLLEDLNLPPFSFIVNEERDREVFPYYKKFCEHPNLKFVMFNSIGMHEDFPEMYEHCGDYVEFNYAMFDKSLSEVLELASSKKDKIITSTARWVPRKRVQELAEISPKLVELGFRVKIYGASQSYFTSQKILATNPTFWENHGYYVPGDINEVLKDAQFHYNFVFLKRKTKNRVMRDRLEIATFEALMNGCLPVICSDTSPKWVDPDYSAISIPSTQLNDLPSILNEISDEERLIRIKNFYELSYQNTIGNYEDIINKIKEVVK